MTIAAMLAEAASGFAMDPAFGLAETITVFPARDKQRTVTAIVDRNVSHVHETNVVDLDLRRVRIVFARGTDDNAIENPTVDWAVRLATDQPEDRWGFHAIVNADATMIAVDFTRRDVRSFGNTRQGGF